MSSDSGLSTSYDPRKVLLALTVLAGLLVVLVFIYAGGFLLKLPEPVLNRKDPEPTTADNFGGVSGSGANSFNPRDTGDKSKSNSDSSRQRPTIVTPTPFPTLSDTRKRKILDKLREKLKNSGQEVPGAVLEELESKF